MAKDIVNVSVDGDLNIALKLKKVVDEYKKHYVKIGVLGGNEPDGTPCAQIGLEHEMGTVGTKTFDYKGQKVTVKGVPARSWLRVPVKEALKGGLYIEQLKSRVVEDLVDKEYTGKGFELMGTHLKEGILDAFANHGANGEWEKNISKKYIALKGSDTPLIDSDNFVHAVDYEVI